MHSFLCRIKLTVSDHHGITLTFRTAAPRRSESHEYRWPLWRFNFRAPRREYCIACIVQRDFQFELGTEGDLQTHLAVKFQPPKEAAHSPKQECRPEFNFSATLVNSQLVSLPPVGIFNLVMFI